MKILLTQHYEQREPRTAIALLDLAVYGRKHGHTIDVAYADEDHDWAAYDAIGYSAIDLCQQVRDDLESLVRRSQRTITLGGKAVNAILPEDKAWLDSLGVQGWTGGGERWLHDEKVDYSTYPEWSELDFGKLNRADSIVEMMTSRGCPYHCHFCNNTEPKVVQFSPERTAKNAALIVNTFGRSRVFFVDDIFAVNSQRMLDILDACDRIGVDLRCKVQFFVHVKHLVPKVLDAIQIIHPMEVQIGIESGDSRMLKAMGKTFTPAEAEDALQNLYERNVRVAALFLMGFPGETPESLEHTVNFMDRNRKYMSGWCVGYYQPIPYTRGWQLAAARLGRIVTGYRNDDITYLDPNLTERQLREARQAAMVY